eukprot:1884145-Rhodomonas_salina.1
MANAWDDTVRNQTQETANTRDRLAGMNGIENAVSCTQRYRHNLSQYAYMKTAHNSAKSSTSNQFPVCHPARAVFDFAPHTCAQQERAGARKAGAKSNTRNRVVYLPSPFYPTTAGAYASESQSTEAGPSSSIRYVSTGHSIARA